MVNKQWLIKLTNEDNLFYDSEEKVYRYRMHCPHCGKVSGCICYNDLETAELDVNEVDVCCSAKCCLEGGEWDELDEALQAVGLEKDLKQLLSNLTDSQLKEAYKDYEISTIVDVLYALKSDIPLSHLKNPNKEEAIEIIIAMGDAKDILWNLGISYYPEIKDLSEEDARKVISILTEDADFDNYPRGDFCKS